MSRSSGTASSRSYSSPSRSYSSSSPSRNSSSSSNKSNSSSSSSNKSSSPPLNGNAAASSTSPSKPLPPTKPPPPKVETRVETKTIVKEVPAPSNPPPKNNSFFNWMIPSIGLGFLWGNIVSNSAPHIPPPTPKVMTETQPNAPLGEDGCDFYLQQYKQCLTRGGSDCYNIRDFMMKRGCPNSLLEKIDS
jgi:hypothetical protein